VVVAILGIALAAAGCVTKEVHTAQVNRTTNLQRLLAEEEKRSAELAAEVARLKKQVGDLELQNKGLTAQLASTQAQVVRSLEEVGRLQEEIQRARSVVPSPAPPRSKSPAAFPAPTEPPDRLGELQGEPPGAKKSKAPIPADETVGSPPVPSRSKSPAAFPAPIEPPDRLGELQGESSGDKKAKMLAPTAEDEPEYLYYEVKKGDTLSNIARRYKTDVKTLRDLNDLIGTDIRVGDILIVGQKP